MFYFYLLLQVAPAWEDEHPRTHGGGGLLKVPPQAVVGATDNEADQGESSQKKKKKKKKKKSAESGGQPQGSAKRTKKPIEFNLGTMLQTISVRLILDNPLLQNN